MASKNPLTYQESLWTGAFGSDYTNRNPKSIPQRMFFWEETMNALRPERTLEVGCGVGLNLEHIWNHTEVWAVDLNDDALTYASTVPDVRTLKASGHDLPFRDEYFDLIFTAGVLIHQHPDTVMEVMRHIARCSKKWVMCIEYEADEFEEIPYRGKNMSLFKGPYPTLYGELGLNLEQQGVLKMEMGFDNCSWSLFSK